MKNTKLAFASRTAGTGLAIALGLAVAGCGGMPTNRSLNSVHQPVVEKVNYTLDLNTGSGGLAYGEARRLTGWFDALGVRYGDRISIDDPTQSPAARDAIANLASRYGLLLAGEAPATEGYVPAGSVRVVITRTQASVPGCPDWSAKSDTNFNNALSSNYGCATNANLAAMVANPEDLLHGARNDSDTVVMSSSKAIDAYREAEPTGKKGLKETSTKEN